jgi:Protein of unknown function (DUF3179)
MATESRRSTSSWLWITFAGSALATIALFFIPAFVIRPFSYQAPRALWWAMAIRQRSPLATFITCVLCVVLTFALWRTVSVWRKIALCAAMVLVTFSAVMARMNYFEWMFHPVKDVQFVAESQSKLDAGEMIMAIHFGGDARAYPISEMAYHHIVNDVVGGVPVTVTY